MTLILTLGNVDQVVQISDRRVTCDGSLVDDESAKAAILECENARFAYGFTGLARFGDFSTRKWLRDSLADCGSPDYEAVGIIQRLRERASHDFVSNPNLRRMKRGDKRLSVLFSGYLYHHDPPLWAFALLSNFQDLNGPRFADEAWDEFGVSFFSEKRPAPGESHFVECVGSTQEMAADDRMTLRRLLMSRKPARAIVGKGADVVRQIAERPATGGAVGHQLDSIVVPRDREQPVGSSYHTARDQCEAYGADYMLLIRAGHILMGDVSMTVAKNPKAKKSKAGRSRPCPCGSGKAYMHCCGGPSHHAP